jgi:hypothetical protein
MLAQLSMIREVADIGFPAVLVRLPAVSLERLEELIADAWRCVAPKD